ncbi:MAG: peptide-methionine (S)-S-oxide reductase MsrA [Candidatus Kerfeldbacteria bacterium]|nr:peptide-methionine (S)-S-oxide reductase MsrA [Candidatus Kerfeldbacteria bacterium]
MGRPLATFGAGCFWCSEAIFKQLRGVTAVISGYAGGSMPNPTYEQVCSDQTGHAEVIQIEFDPEIISYQQLVEVFFLTHDPTQLNRQDNDVGAQYRSVIFYHHEAQQAAAEAVKQKIEAEGIYDRPLVTEIVPFDQFYPAENYHQNYFANNPDQPYCQTVISPKVAKFRKKFISILKSP